MLNDQDEIWVRYRNTLITDSIHKINEEIRGMLAESNKIIHGAKSGEEMKIEEITKIIRANPKQEEMMKRY